MANLKTKIGRLELKNPVTVASGTFGYGEEFHDNFYDLGKLGAVFTKGISLLPRVGNPPQRIFETASGMLNAIGLQNVGVDVFLKEKVPFLKKAGATVIVNIFGETVDQYAELAGRLSGVDGVHGIELNVSCPNVKAGGVQFGTDTKLLKSVVEAVRKANKDILIVKLSPNCSDIAGMAKLVEDAGADAVSLINTLTGMAIDSKTRRPVLANVVGGLSGPAIKPVALRMVHQVYKAVKIPIIGMGGIMNATDAVEFIIAGSAAIQIGTANFVNPNVAMEVAEGIEGYLKEHKMSMKDLVGSLRV